MSSTPRGAALAEYVLARSGHDRAQVIVEERAHIDQRWALSSGTTNGATTTTQLTVILVDERAHGVATASCTSSISSRDDIHDVIARSHRELADARHDEAPAQPVALGVDDDFGEEAVSLEPAEIAAVLASLGSINARLASRDIESFGYLERERATTWLATSAGIRRRSSEITDRLEITAKSDGRRRSTWHGQATLDVADGDLLIERLSRELAWQGVRCDVDPGLHTVVLSPSAVADLCVDYLWSSGARDAVEGRTALHDAESPTRTRLGMAIGDSRVSLASDPHVAKEPRMETSPFALTTASGRYASVLDNGRDRGIQTWIHDGVLTGLHGPTSDVATFGIPATPIPGNLIVDVEGGRGGLEDLVATVANGLLVTCLWYIRSVDPQTMTVTGLTRDGVYLVRDGRIVGAAGNFRFNDSPLGMLNRIDGSGLSVRTLPREMADYANRTVVPPLVVRDWNLASRSDAV